MIFDCPLGSSLKHLLSYSFITSLLYPLGHEQVYFPGGELMHKAPIGQGFKALHSSISEMEIRKSINLVIKIAMLS